MPFEYFIFLAGLLMFTAGLLLWRADQQMGNREQWAAKNGFTYAKTDPSLDGEWRRGAASKGAAATNVAAGSKYGHDTYIADLGLTPVIAMTTGEVSDVVVDMRRGGGDGTAAGAVGGAADEAASDDLHVVAEVEGFTIFGTHEGPVRRFIDVRVTTALEQMPPSVKAVWLEGEWAVAQLAHAAGPEEWERTFAPLALLADAARTLPPVAARDLVEGVEVGVDKQKVLRPEQPLELPTRVTGTTRGVVDPREVGADPVEAIVGDTQAGNLTRAPRAPKPPSIFEEDTNG